MDSVALVLLSGSLPLDPAPFRDALSESLHAPVALEPHTVDAASCMDPARRQFLSPAMLDLLLREGPSDAPRILGMCGVDLFVPILTFVFGQAQLGGRAALFSTFRLRDEYYGLPARPGLLFERAVKEAMHELGHTYGMRHCADLPCVMNASTYVEDIDQKPAAYCDHCTRILHAARLHA
jgi:archaemetzincin